MAGRMCIAASNHSGTPGLGFRWMKSVSRYGAFGNASSHAPPSGNRFHPRAHPRACSSLATSAMPYGTHARNRFHTRKMKLLLPLHSNRRWSITTATTLLSSTGGNP